MTYAAAPLTNNTPETEVPENTVLAKIGEQEIDAIAIIERQIAMQHWQAIQDCLDSFVIELAFKQNGIVATDKELYEHINAFRHEHSLLTGADTHKWLDSQHMDENDFLQMCNYDLCLGKLKTLLFSARIEELFAYSQVNFITIELYKIALAKEEAAKEIISSIQDGASFFDYARKYSIDRASAKSCGYLGKMKMRTLSPQLQDLLSKAPVGSVVGPVKERNSFDVYLVDSKSMPVLDDEIKKELEDELFKQWLTTSISKFAEINI